MFVIVGVKLDTSDWRKEGKWNETEKFKRLTEPLSFLDVSLRIYWICTDTLVAARG